MEYLYYILGALLIGLLVLQAVRFATKQKYQRALHEYDKRRMQQAAVIKHIRKNNLESHTDIHPTGNYRGSSPVVRRQMRRQRTPWGWPQYRKINAGGAGPVGLRARLHSFVHLLTNKKELLSGQAGDLRRSNSVRALLEDRYGPVGRDSMPSIEYTKVRRPLLRDPSQPHDQMDNLGTRKAELLRAKLKRMRAMNADPDAAAKDTDFRYVDPKDVKKPWGW